MKGLVSLFSDASLKNMNIVWMVGGGGAKARIYKYVIVVQSLEIFGKNNIINNNHTVLYILYMEALIYFS